MKLPHHRYVAYLVLLGLEDNEIERVLILDDLVPPAPAELARLRYDLSDQPQPLRAFDSSHRISAEWLLQQGLSGLVRDKPAVREALSILRSPILRQPAELLLLGGHPPALLPRFCTDHDLAPVGEQGAAHFRHYFWDVTGLAMDEWAQFLLRHPNGEVYKQVLGEGAPRAITLADLFVTRLKRMPLFSTVPGCGGGGGYVQAPPLFLPKSGPEPVLAEP